MPSPKNLSYSPFAIMNRGEVIGALNRWKWPVAGVAAAFVGSLYTLGFSQVFQLYASDDKEVAGTSSYGVKGLLKKLIHDFIQGGKSPDNPPLSPSEASMIIRKNEKRVDVNSGVVYYYDTNNLASNNPMEDRNTECRIIKNNGFLFSVFDGHGGWQCAEAVKNRLPLYIALSLLEKSELGRFEKKIIKDLLLASLYSNGSTSASSNTNETSSLTTDYTLSKKQDIFHTGPKYLVQSLKDVLNGDDKLTAEESLSLAYSQLDDDISAEAIPLKMLDDSFVIGATGACAVSAYVEGDSIYLANSGELRVSPLPQPPHFYLSLGSCIFSPHTPY
ncbi:pyruvate dehydrogenase [acetyl-transferring]-phosphatase 2, mitochondrial-like [Actinia tenebrosa]|uniref:Pyruvate dehydrogenase [acetyl-transferring]-phosphatase 2, mitochondrial-like n=1 Tax=Actinia tenebrosa TaxID=6105 RepID=A0A6P8ICD1_ACTTE|nr:pyruvate dehydrogenase [acetyl-transferring]-phosphatase 2, mitochondrial-like [Actinia tenebrosa]